MPLLVKRIRVIYLVLVLPEEHRLLTDIKLNTDLLSLFLLLMPEKEVAYQS